jgi:hypothetical protein
MIGAQGISGSPDYGNTFGIEKFLQEVAFAGRHFILLFLAPHRLKNRYSLPKSGWMIGGSQKNVKKTSAFPPSFFQKHKGISHFCAARRGARTFISIPYR